MSDNREEEAALAVGGHRGCLWRNAPVWSLSRDLVFMVRIHCGHCGTLNTFLPKRQARPCYNCGQCPCCWRLTPHEREVVEGRVCGSESILHFYEGSQDWDSRLLGIPRLAGPLVAMLRELGALPGSLDVERSQRRHSCVWPLVPLNEAGRLIWGFRFVCKHCRKRNSFRRGDLPRACRNCERCVSCSPGAFCAAHNSCAFLCLLKNHPGHSGAYGYDARSMSACRYTTALYDTALL